MRVEAVISTGDMARDDAIIDPAGWDFTNYRRNPIVLFNHNDHGGLPVARTVSGPTPNGAELIATAEFDAADPEAMRLLGKIQRGYINSTSVRWIPKRWEYVKTTGTNGEERSVLVFREQELLEWSFVNIPADPGAVILRSDGEGIDLTEFPDLSLQAQDEEEPPAEEPEEPPEEADEPEDDRPDGRTLAILERLEALVAARSESVDIDALVVTSLAKQTGKSEERIRREMAEGAYQ